MNRFAYTRQDHLIRGIVLPIFVLILNSILLGSIYWHDWRLFIITTAISSFIYYFHWFTNNAIALWTHRLYPSYHQFALRALVSYILVSCSSSAITFVIFQLYKLVGYTLVYERQVWAFGFVLGVVILVASIYEGTNALEQWKKYFIESESLKKAQLQSQLEVLKNQVNPHFLFNSLNSLGSLIEEDPKQASRFLDELSSVYRYLLRTNDQDLVELHTEIQFIQSYFNLLHTRHGSSLQLVMDIDPSFHQHQIPPLTLQLLVENAVKHNIILPDQELVVQIRTDKNGELLVSNNLQRKKVRVLSNGVGLNNILTKYRMLGQASPKIEEQDGQFMVTLPLILQA
ncbi:histidine kinase [Cytophagaceae bacterium YF14B1]|uniref:Histidine kinase n=1 Tax=Xanthocytophaga flava TaxID=3048013 RepID=A0AAE3QU86_9BACT|nr:histidine kinase [Xanthocytophaga flavus]MDJ1483325.1 histidine kinase [Xanthocytophaga flavus]